MNPYENYQKQMVTTMTQGEMLRMLYDGIIKQIDVAKAAIEAENLQELGVAINKAEKIVRYLRATLDFRYPVSRELASFYDFFNAQLSLANVKKDTTILDGIRPLVQELRDTFVECARMDRAGRSVNAANAAQTPSTMASSVV